MLAASLALAACSNPSDSKANEARNTIATSTTVAPSAAPETTQPSQLRRSDLTPPAQPVGGEYDIAAQAAWAAYQDKDFETAEALITRIADPALKADTIHDVDVAEGAAATWAAYQDRDFSAAAGLEAQIEDAQVRTNVQMGINQAQGDDYIGARSTWNGLYTDARSEWNDHYTEARSDWNDLYQHTTAYVEYYNSLPE